MPLDRLLENQAFGPEQVSAMTFAFEAICRERKLRPGKDERLREQVARHVIAVASRGESDPERLRKAVASTIRL